MLKNKFNEGLICASLNNSPANNSFSKSLSRKYAANWVERRTMLNSPVGCERAATGALAGATGFAAVPAAQSAAAKAWFCFAP